MLNKTLYFTPGPSQLYPTVAQHISQALMHDVCTISHRSQQFKGIMEGAVTQMRNIWDIPEEYSLFFHASATEIWERLLQNCVREQSFHLVNGAFSSRFYQAALDLGLKAEKLEVAWGEAFGKEILDLPAGTEMLNFTHNETSTGVMLPWEWIYAHREKYPEVLITVDMVSSAPVSIPDWKLIDAAYFSIQKTMGLPAGLGVLALSPRCLQKAIEKKNAGYSIGTYHSFTAQQKRFIQNQTVETPNMLGIYLLGAIAADMGRKGMDTIRKEILSRAAQFYEILESHPRFKAFVRDKDYQSYTVIVAEVEGGSANLINMLKAQDIVVGKGYGPKANEQIRIANFPAFSNEDVEKLLSALKSY